MKKQEVEELKHKLEVQRGILYACKDVFDDIKYLQGDGIASKVETELLDFYQWRFINELLWNYLILELHKLYSDKGKDEYRIKAVLNVLNNQFKNLPFKDRLSKNCISLLLTEFNCPVFSEHFKKLNGIRDKYVAHLDRDRTDLRIENEDIEYFLKLNERIIKEVLDPIENGGTSYYFGKPVTFKDFVRKIGEYKTVHDKIEYGVLDPEERKKLKPETEIDLLRMLGKTNFIVEGII